MPFQPSAIRSRILVLLVQYHATPTLACRNQIATLNRGLVRKVARKLSQTSTEPFEDLEQVGYLGLIQAIERFQPEQGYAFSSFAVPYIRGEILHYLRDRSSVVKTPRRWQELQRSGEKARIKLKAELGRSPLDEEIAEALGIDLQEWQEVKIASNNRRYPHSLDAIVYRDSSGELEGQTLGDVITYPESRSQRWDDEGDRPVQASIRQLEEKSRIAIECIFFVGLSRKEAANKLGVSPTTVTRRIQRGIEEMIGMV